AGDAAVEGDQRAEPQGLDPPLYGLDASPSGGNKLLSLPSWIYGQDQDQIEFLPEGLERVEGRPGGKRHAPHQAPLASVDAGQRAHLLERAVNVRAGFD